MSRRTISPGGAVNGLVELPGDKAISHRYAIIASLAAGRSEIANYSAAADCGATLECLRQLGVKVESADGRVSINGVGIDGWKQPVRELNAHNSGTTMRMLAGALAGQSLKAVLTGDISLRRRPMGRIIDPLRSMGAQIHGSKGGRAPLEIQGTKLHAIDYETVIPSAQVKSAMLFAGLFADGSSTFREAIRTRDHTEIALREFGAAIETTSEAIRICPRPKLIAQQLTVPGDLSAAVFLISAALVLPESSLVLHNVGLNPTRAEVLDFFLSIGAPIQVTSIRMQHGELIGDVSIRHAPLIGGTIAGHKIPKMIDELPMLAALGPFTDRGIEIHDATELRVKESDRIANLAEGLRRMGAQVREFPDGLRVEGRAAGKLHGAKIDPRGDHRIAMALAVTALAAEGNTTIVDADCAKVSFPEFFSTLDRLRGVKKSWIRRD